MKASSILPLAAILSISLASGAPIDDLASPDQGVRDRAAEVLRATFKETPEAKWTAAIDAIKEGQTKKEVLELLRPFNVTDAGGEFETGFSPIHARSYRLDHEWLLTCYFHDEDERLTGRKLVKLLEHVWVPPPENFTGTWVVYWANGHKSHEIEYKDGKYFGRFIVYHEDGSKKLVQHYAEDGIPR
jgi:hypothetical protein